MSGAIDFDLPNDPAELKRRLTAAIQKIQELQAQIKLAQEKSESQVPRGGMDAGMEVAPINESDVTLRRLVQRIAMILQAEKIVIMFYDREQGDLCGITPAYGIEESRVPHFKVRATQGISGQVFRDGEPVIFHDANNDPRTQKDPFSLLGVQNGITVPLVLEQRDEENRVVDKTTIGVLHAFNKRHGEDFNEEDVRLLERMAKNVGSIIANLQLYREVIEQREELLQTFESLTAGLILVTAEGKVTQMNASARAIFGAGNDAVGKQYHDVINVEEFKTVYDMALRGEETPRRDITTHIAGIERHYQMQAALVRSEEGKEIGVVFILNDITELMNIDKMKSSFVAMASHELRTPLTAIKGFSTTLLDGVEDALYSVDEQKEFLGIVVHECDRLRRLIDDLLNTARIESGESLKPNYTEVDMNTLVQKVVTIQKQASHKHTILSKIEGTLPVMVGDEDKLDQILTNLLNNSIKYAPNGGDIIVHAKVEGKDLVMCVEDHGMGIPKDHVAKIFEKFHRVNNDDNRKIYGTGLGLYLVKHLVEKVHMGTIWCESEVGVGSKFWIRIPTDIDIEKAKELNT
ncbi:MAG: GAF domain-containing protein [Fimbriimonadaceae bacterium]|nr:GAF domain-containing protein [Fimbriimonadaceae bacterium]